LDCHEKGGLFRYERASDNFTRFLDKPSAPVSLVKDIVSVLLADHDNNIWVGTGFGNLGTGLVRFNPSTKSTKRFTNDPLNENSLLDNRISALYQDQQGQILIGTYKCGLHSYNKENKSIRRIKLDSKNLNKLHAPYIDHQITTFDLNREDPFVEIIHQDENGGYWIGTAGAGINYFDPVTNKQSFYGTEASYSGEFNLSFRTFGVDSHGGIWVASMGGFLYRKDIYARKFTFHPKTLKSEKVYESMLNPGIIWAGSEGKWLKKIDLKTGKITAYLHDKNNSKSIARNFVRNVYQENRNTLWVGIGNIGGDDGGEDGLGGLDKLDINSGNFTHYKVRKKGSDFSQTVYTLQEDNQGYLWLGTGSGGLFRSNKEKTRFEYFNFPNPDSVSIDPVIYEVIADSKGRIWASDAELDGAGTVYIYNANQQRFFPFLKGFEATNILEDKNKKGWYWISTWAKGILHYNPTSQTYKQYTTEDGLSSNLSNYIVGGEEGIYWIATRSGPCRLDSKTNQITPLNLPSDRFYFGTSKTSDGQLFFTSFNKGLVSFHPNQIKGNLIPPKQ